MKAVVTHLHVDEPYRNIHPDGLVILSGDAPVWKYCDMFHMCIKDGSAVVAVAFGIDVSTNAADAVIAYAVNAAPEYLVGRTLRDADKAYMEKRTADPNYRAELQAAVDAGNRTLGRT